MKCETCKKEFKPKQNHPRYKYCSVECNLLAREKRINTPLKLNEYILNKNDIIITFNNKKIDKKRLFEYSCDGCGNIFNTTINYLIKKKKYNRWLCRSCSSKNNWNDEQYSSSHINGCLNSWTPQRREYSRQLMKNNWKKTSFKNKMLNILNDPIIKQKSLNNRKYNRIDAYGVSFRSNYEYRFATILNKLKIEWKYEPQFFRLKSFDNKIYFPDFYLPQYDIWIEVKGYFTEIAKKKFESFKIDYPNINIKIIYLQELQQIENGNINEIIK